MRPKVLFVTDPMCSWCWGMASQVERVRHDTAEEFDFDLVLGGINVAATQPVTDFSRRRLALIWQNVIEVTDARFGPGLPGGDFVYNSTQACIAAEAARALLERAPFEYVLRLQHLFFVEGLDVTSESLLVREAVALGMDETAFDEARRSAHVRARVNEQFARAKRYGTAALPSVLLEMDGVTRLIAGGYIDAPTLLDALRDRVAR